MGRIGFDIKNEFLPSFDKFQNEINQRMMFLKLFNQEVSCDMKFSKEELKESKSKSLFDLFAKKICSNLLIDSYTQVPLVKIDVEKSIKINGFIKKLDKCSSQQISNFSIKNTLSETNIDVAVKLINILEESNFSFYLDGEKIFRNFVSNKILNSGHDREVTVNNDSIDIVSQQHKFQTKIYTFWEFIDSKDLNVDEHIKKAVKCIETTDFKQVYLVYPKNENFNKHIQIKSNDVTCSEYEIKLIPYSMRSTLR